MSEHEEGSPPGGAGPDGADSPRSPFARPPGYEGNIGYGPPAEPPEHRFASVPYGSAHASTDLPTAEYPTESESPTSEFPAYGAPYGQPAQPWFEPAAYAPPGDELSYHQPGSARRRKPWALVAILVIALAAGGTTVGILSSSSKSGSPTVADPQLPGPFTSPAPAPSTTPSPGSSGGSSGPSSPSGPSGQLPNVGLPTPPALLAIGYHVYFSGLQQPSEVAIDAAEQVQFKKDGLERIVGLRALTIGQPGDTNDDYDADISVLRFKDAAGAKAELDYSNMRNKADSGATTISLPGLPQVTAFLNKESSGYSIGAFASVGRYQVVLILGGLSPNAPTNSSVLAAEAARVMKALLPAAATIEPDTSGSGSAPGSPSQAPSPAPSQVPSQDPGALPSATPSGIHA